MISRVAAIALGAMIAATTNCVMADTIPFEDYATCQELFDEYRFADGLVPLRRAAEGGHVIARRTLGLMLLYGQDLYASEVQGDRSQALQWLRLAAAGEDDVSKHVLVRLAHSEQPRKLTAQR